MLSISNVKKSFEVGKPKGAEILGGVDLEIANGEFFCLLGSSGCGKTTLMNMVAGFEHPTSGSILLDGAPTDMPGSDRVVVFQNADAALFPWLSAEENVAFPLRMKGESNAASLKTANELLNLVGLGEHRTKLPKHLSGGMKQRVQLARGLALKPAVLLLDEPFAALDAISRRLMHGELLRIWNVTKTTILFITHDVGEAVILADRIGVMSGGPSARLKAVMDIKLDRPRQTGDAEFAHYHGLIERTLIPEAMP
jgi:NitT/TauT family transport system ATP-binding protein